MNKSYWKILFRRKKINIEIYCLRTGECKNIFPSEKVKCPFFPTRENWESKRKQQSLSQLKLLFLRIFTTQSHPSYFFNIFMLHTIVNKAFMNRHLKQKKNNNNKSIEKQRVQTTSHKICEGITNEYTWALLKTALLSTATVLPDHMISNLSHNNYDNLTHTLT